MHQSSSYYLQSSSSSVSPLVATGAAALGPSSTASVLDVDQLPTYDPRSDVAKKEALDASRADLARALVHLIPVVVLLCGLLLWSLSNTNVLVVGILVEKGDSRTTVARVMIMPQNSGTASSWKESVSMSATKDLDPILDKAHGTNRRLVLRSEMERGKQFRPRMRFRVNNKKRPI